MFGSRWCSVGVLWLRVPTGISLARRRRLEIDGVDLETRTSKVNALTFAPIAPNSMLAAAWKKAKKPSGMQLLRDRWPEERSVICHLSVSLAPSLCPSVSPCVSLVFSTFRFFSVLQSLVSRTAPGAPRGAQFSACCRTRLNRKALGHTPRWCCFVTRARNGSRLTLTSKRVCQD